MEPAVLQLAEMLCVSPRRARLALDAASGSMDRAAELILSGAVQTFSSPSSPRVSSTATIPATTVTPKVIKSA